MAIGNIFKYFYRRKKQDAIDFLYEKGMLKGQRNYTQFVLGSHGRCGTNLLLSYLGSHPNVLTHGEAFSSQKKYAAYNKIRQEDPVKYLNEVIFKDYPSNVQAVGFKIFYYHATEGKEPEIWGHLESQKQIPIIHLIRKNYLRILTSLEIAYKTNKWEQVEMINKVNTADKRVTISIERAESFFKEYGDMTDKFRREYSNHSYYELYYEDLVANPQKHLKDLSSLLKLPPHGFKTALSKQNKEGLSQLIINFDELKVHFEKTKYSSFFVP